MIPTGLTPDFGGRLVLLGCGCIGRAMLLLLRHVALAPAQVLVLVLVIKPRPQGLDSARALGVQTLTGRLDESNFRQLLAPHLGPGDFLLNLSVDVSSAALIALARERGALYLDTCIEPWADGFLAPGLSPAQRSNYALREAALALRRLDRDDPTALIAHGANPGLVSHFVKQALLDLAAATGLDRPPPQSREGWARLAQALGVRVIHIAERDTQVAAGHKQPGEFVNTWSVEGFVDEATQPAELGWGSHERQLPADGRRHAGGCRAAIYLNRPGAAALPVHRAQRLPPLRRCGAVAARIGRAQLAPPAALAGADGRHRQRRRRARRAADGPCPRCLLVRYGSRLDIARARALCPDNGATSPQVAAGVLAGVVWALQHPAQGIVEPDELPHDALLALARPYLDEVLGACSDWTPLAGRGGISDAPARPAAARWRR